MKGDVWVSVRRSFGEGFIWGALIGAAIRHVGLRNWAIIFGGIYVANYFLHASEQRGIADAMASGASVEIVSFDTTNPYHPTLMAQVTNPSSETLESFSVQCANIHFNSDEPILPGREALIQVPSFFDDRFADRRVDPFVQRASVACEFEDADLR